MTVRWIGVLARLLVLAVLAMPGAASAHAFLIETAPEDGTSLATAPAEIRLRFNEPVTPIALELLDDRGRPVMAGQRPDAAGDRLRLALPEPLEAGVYTIRYRVTSADGHPGAGTITFGVGVAPPVPDGPAESGTPSIAIAAWMMRWLHLAALLGGFGGGLFVLLTGGTGGRATAAARPSLRALMVLAAATGVLRVGLDGTVLLGGTAGDLFGADAWTVGTAGPAAALAMAAALCGLSGLRHSGGRWRAGALAVAAALAVLSLLVTGHAATAPPRWAAASLMAAHGLAAAFWIGSLWPLLVVVRAGPPATAAVIVHRFSAVAVVAVGILIAAGAGLSLLQGVRPDTLLTDGYGRLWTAKMLLVAALVGVALWNRAVALPRLDPDPPRSPSSRALQAGIRVEIGLVAAILLLTAAFPLTPPPRSGPGAEAVPEGYSAVAVVGPITAVLDVTPARVGANRMRLHLSGGETAGAGVTTVAEWSLPGVEPVLLRLPAGNGGADVRLPAEGRWTVRIRPDEPDAAVIAFAVPIGGP